jgi:hypothetical protein
VGKVKDLQNTNIAALNNLVTTAPGNYEFRKTQTKYKAVREGKNYTKIRLPEEDFAYGVRNKYDDSFRYLIANGYG